jgi:hypothetical protein
MVSYNYILAYLEAFQAPLGQGTNVLVIIRVLIIHSGWKDWYQYCIYRELYTLVGRIDSTKMRKC